MNYIEEALKEANKGIKKQHGGPFGAIIVKDNKIIGKGHNQVLKKHDPTSHAEINAIKDASKKLKTHDLSGCIIYTTSQPCPMCLSAIIWSNIKEIYYATDKKEVANIGFRDDFIYEYIKHPNNTIKITQIENKDCKQLLKNYNNKLY